MNNKKIVIFLNIIAITFWTIFVAFQIFISGCLIATAGDVLGWWDIPNWISYISIGMGIMIVLRCIIGTVEIIIFGSNSDDNSVHIEEIEEWID